MRQKPVRAYLTPELAEEVARRAQAQDRSESAIISDAVRSRFAATSDEAIEAEGETVRRQLNRVEARLDKLIWEQLQTKECVLLFIRVWLEHNPPLDAELEESAAISAEARFERFLDLLSNNLNSRNPTTDLAARIDGANRNCAQTAEAAP